MTISADEVAEITANVWASLLERSLLPSGESTPAGLSEAPPLGAEVTIAGAWDGRVRIHTTSDLARQITVQLFMLPEDELDDDLINDAIGELVNIVGGNVKALLPSGCQLGLPGPTGGAAGEVVAQVELICDDHPVVVVVERAGPTGNTGTGATAPTPADAPQGDLQ